LLNKYKKDNFFVICVGGYYKERVVYMDNIKMVDILTFSSKLMEESHLLEKFNPKNINDLIAYVRTKYKITYDEKKEKEIIEVFGCALDVKYYMEELNT
jgi:hypothetical protein